MKFLICLFLVCGFGCQSFAMAKKPANEFTAPVKAPVQSEVFSISWEKNHPERKEWTKFTRDLIGGELFDTYDSAKDATRICPKYHSLAKEQKVTVWTEFVSAFAYYESAWNPTSWMTETTMGTDPITGRQVKSEGLLQLSYQDTQWARYCQFNWAQDKKLSQDDPKKTIFDAKLNLECGLKILRTQIHKKGYVIISKGVYWAVLKEGGRYQKISQIIGMVQKTGLCN